jgi:hypothetical protein
MRTITIVHRFTEKGGDYAAIRAKGGKYTFGGKRANLYSGGKTTQFCVKLRNTVYSRYNEQKLIPKKHIRYK